MRNNKSLQVLINLNCSISAGVNVSYTFDFGDGSYVLTTCPNTTHVYTSVGHFRVKASARTNMSGPIMASTWVFIQSSTGILSLDYPQEIVESENETEIVVTVSQGTWMKARLVTKLSSSSSLGNVKRFNISGKARHTSIVMLSSGILNQRHP